MHLSWFPCCCGHHSDHGRGSPQDSFLSAAWGIQFRVTIGLGHSLQNVLRCHWKLRYRATGTKPPHDACAHRWRYRHDPGNSRRDCNLESRPATRPPLVSHLSDHRRVANGLARRANPHHAIALAARRQAEFLRFIISYSPSPLLTRNTCPSG